MIRQLRVTVKLHIPRRSPVSMCAFHAGTLKSSVASSMATRKVTIVRTFLITDAGSLEASSCSMKHRNPLWTTLRIFTYKRIRASADCQVTLYTRVKPGVGHSGWPTWRTECLTLAAKKPVR